MGLLMCSPSWAWLRSPALTGLRYVNQPLSPNDAHFLMLSLKIASETLTWHWLVCSTKHQYHDEERCKETEQKQDEG